MTAGLFDLSGRVALVTGASGGIGQAMAVALATAGASVVVTARRRPQLDETVASIDAAGGRASAIEADLSSLSKLPAVAEAALAPFGPPLILVNCAGVNLRQPFDEVTPDTWRQTVDLNLAVPFFLARSLLPGMREARWGRVINIASLQSRRAFPDSIPYGASKGGVEQLTRAMAEAWSRDGINCNAIGPGFFPTDLTRAVFEDETRREWAASQTAIGRNGQMRDLDGATIFLASRASDYITGQTLYVDGGFTAR